MEEQQKRNTKQIEKETIIRNIAGSSNTTAQVLRADATVNTDINTSQILRNVRTREAFAQASVKTSEGYVGTVNPKMKETGSQAWKPNVSSSSTQSNIQSSNMQALSFRS